MKLDELESLLAAATPGPWRSCHEDTEDDARSFIIGEARMQRNDAAAVVALVNAAPALLRVARAAKAWRECEYAPPEVHDEPRFYGNAREAFDELRAAVEALEVNDG